MKNFENAFAMIANNPILSTEDNNKIEGISEKTGRTISIIRSFYLGETTQIPEQSVSILVDGHKVYGGSTEYYSNVEIHAFNILFAKIQKRILNKLADRQVEAKNYFKSQLAAV